jgi:Lar family restriction alleviation protein
MTAGKIVERLKPCPFCGGEANFVKGPDKVHPYRGSCASCGFCTAHHGSFQAAIDAWQSRTPEAATITSLTAEVERLKDALFRAKSWLTIDAARAAIQPTDTE